MPLRPILSAVDFSEQSRDALLWAGEFAARRQHPLHVLTAVDPLLVEAARQQLAQDLRSETETALREFVAATWPQDPARASDAKIEARVGDAPAVILDTAASQHPVLIVMGTQGLGGLRKWILGSTTERVLRRTTVPVLAVPPGSRAPGISRVLASSDFSSASIAAVKAAAEVADQFTAALSLVHVVERPAVPSEWRDVAAGAESARSADARARLNELARQICGAGKCSTFVSVGRPADAIAALAEERRADLIVLGLTGEQGPRAPRPGSIAYRVLCCSSIPVLVVPGT